MSLLCSKHKRTLRERLATTDSTLRHPSKHVNIDNAYGILLSDRISQNNSKFEISNEAIYSGKLNNSKRKIKFSSKLPISDATKTAEKNYKLQVSRFIAYNSERLKIPLMIKKLCGLPLNL